jgi:hypothetical protein
MLKKNGKENASVTQKINTVNLSLTGVYCNFRRPVSDLCLNGIHNDLWAN